MNTKKYPYLACGDTSGKTFRLFHNGAAEVKGTTHEVLTVFVRMAQMQPCHLPAHDDFYHASFINDINAGKYNCAGDAWEIFEVK